VVAIDSGGKRELAAGRLWKGVCLHLSIRRLQPVADEIDKLQGSVSVTITT